MKNFWYLFAAYTIVWSFIFAYIVNLTRKNNALREELHDLQLYLEKIVSKKETPQ